MSEPIDRNASTLPPAPKPAGSPTQEWEQLAQPDSGSAAEAATLPPGDRAAAGPAETATLPPSGSAAPAVGGVVSMPGYEILGELGRGGMGVVYKARQLKLGRLVALKMILAGGHAGAAELVRFRTEAEAIARQQHPNIVQVFEIGEHNGLPFFSLEFCAGGSLEKKLAGTPLPAKEAAQLVEVLARAMEHAHQQGVIHRDLKPANILLAETSRDREGAETLPLPHGRGSSGSGLSGMGIPKITDFGLAKKLEETGQTATGAVMGTPSYMAPEQAGGKKEQLGPATDVYALGAILYECLTGRPPFRAASALDTVLQVVSEEPVPPQQLNAKVPRDLETICLKCLQKDPGKRYARAADLAEDLRSWAAGIPIAARPIGRIERTWRWCRRNRMVATLLVVIVVMLLSGIGVSTYFALDAHARAVEAEKRRTEAEIARGEAKHEAHRANTARYATQLDLAGRDWQEGNLFSAKVVLEQTPVSLRGWEFHYLSNLCDVRMLSFPHSLPEGLAFSPDGQRMATIRPLSKSELTSKGRSEYAGYKGVSIWNARTLAEVCSFEVGHFAPNLIALGPDHQVALVTRTFVPGQADPKDDVRIYAGTDGKEIRTCQGGASAVTCLAMSRDGQRVATGNKHGVLRVWSTATGKLLLDLLPPKVAPQRRAFGSLSFSPDGKKMVAAVGSHLQVWDETGQEVFSQSFDLHEITALSIADDGRHLGLALRPTKFHPGSSGMLAVLDLQTGQKVFSDDQNIPMLSQIHLDHVRQRLAGISIDGDLALWDLAGKKPRYEQRRRGSPPAACALSPDGAHALIARKFWPAADYAVTLSATGPTPKFHILPGDLSRVQRLAFSHDGHYLAYLNGPSGKKQPMQLGVRDMKTANHKVLADLFAHIETFCSSSDGKHVAVSERTGPMATVLKVWDTQSGQAVLTRKLDNRNVHQLSFAPDGQSLTAICRVWGQQNNQYYELASWSLHGEQRWQWSVGELLEQFAFAPDGRHLAVGGLKLRIWRTEDLGGMPLHTFAQGPGQVLPGGLAFSADGKRLVAVSRRSSSLSSPGKITSWDVISGKQVGAEDLSHQIDGEVLFAADSQRFFTRAGNELHIWDMVTGQRLMNLGSELQSLLAIALSRRGILAGSYPDGIRIWTFSTGQDLN